MSVMAVYMLFFIISFRRRAGGGGWRGGPDSTLSKTLYIYANISKKDSSFF